MIAHVRIHGLSIDDQAVRGTATLLQPAVTLGPRTTRLVSLVNYWEFGSAINGFSIRSYMWGCSYGMWSLSFDTGLIRELTELGFHPIENCEVFGLPQSDRFYEYAKLVETFCRKRFWDECSSKQVTSVIDSWRGRSGAGR
jgi:hypothetical protein